MVHNRCKCTGSAKAFHQNNLNNCQYIDHFYFFTRTKDPESRIRMYLFLRCLGHEYEVAWKTANHYHETDEFGNFKIKRMPHMQCSFVHFLSGDVVVDGQNISLSRVTCRSEEENKRKLFDWDYPRRWLSNCLCPMPMPINRRDNFEGTNK